ncbi:MAG: dephospho-CoA kinase [Actinomycetota bacterium]
MAYIVGLTGGIGSGKSTVCALLAARGAIVIDADAIVHELQEPGTDVFNDMVEAFGPDIVGSDGRLDRPKVATIVFSDEDKRKQLNDIVHPRVGEVVAERLSAAGPEDIVVIDVPLMAESPRSGRTYGTVIVVDAKPETQLERLVGRGMEADDARSRMASQASREDRLKLADHIVTNDGSVQDLERQIDELWPELQDSAKRAAS